MSCPVIARPAWIGWIRIFTALTFLLALAGCSGPGPGPAPQPPGGGGAPEAPDTPLSAPTAARMSATIYDDGLACPGGCDAHVVFHPSHNASANAFKPPLAARAAPQACRNGEACMICFGPEAEDCLAATYRGSGPPPGRFDFTPAFFEEACARPNLPAALAAKCSSLDAAIAARGYDRLVNCVADPGHAACAELMTAAEAERQADATERAACLSLGGDAAYNAQEADESRHRIHGCNYFKNRRETNSSGVSWRRLAPGSCRAGTYVGRDGLDCCSASPYAAAALHPECRIYYREG